MACRGQASQRKERLGFGDPPRKLRENLPTSRLLLLLLFISHYAQDSEDLNGLVSPGGAWTNIQDRSQTQVDPESFGKAALHQLPASREAVSFVPGEKSAAISIIHAEDANGLA